MRLLTVALVPALAFAQTAKPAPSQMAHNAGIFFWNMSPKSVAMLLKSVPQRNGLRLAQLKQTFTDLQCRGRQLREESAPGGKNLVCILPVTAPEPPPVTSAGPKGEPDPRTILFLAHYEHQGAGRSAVENWSGALMLPFLYHALSAAPRHHTFVFAEVDGESGAAALFGSLTLAERGDLLGVVSLDALGLGPVQFYINPNDTYAYLAGARLMQPLLQAATDQRLHAPREGVPGSWFKVDASRVFRRHNIPAMLIQSVNWSTREVPGSARDTAAAINLSVYMRTISLLSDYAAELDRQ